MGRWLRAAGHVPDRVLCSTARRTRETWQLAQPELGTDPPVSFEDRVYEASAEELLDLARHAWSAVKTLLIVGHAPGIPELALMLAGASTALDGGDRRRGAAGRRPHESQVPHRRDRSPGADRVLGSAGPGAARLTSFVTPRDVSASQPR